MTIRTVILGASGHAGGELLRLLAGHPAIAVVEAHGEASAGARIADVHPHLAPGFGERRFAAAEAIDLADADLVLACLPHGQSQAWAEAVIASGAAFIDLGADFRLRDAASYERWYDEAHAKPELLGRFVYGLPEFDRAGIARARQVAAPGCYPTAAILALKPLVNSGLILADGLIVDAASGASGAGKVLKAETAFCAVDKSVSPYGLLNHRHTAEMEQALGGRVLFTPHLAPMNRGILATCHAAPARDMAPEEPLRVLRAAYAEAPFVTVVERPPATKWALGSNSAFVTARYDPRTERVLAIAALDNLVKGAAGQMIQCANLMFGLAETAGLPLCGVSP